MDESLASTSQEDGVTLSVGPLTAHATSAELSMLFSYYESAIKDVVICQDGCLHHSKGHALIFFHDKSAAVEAQRELNGTLFLGSPIEVKQEDTSVFDSSLSKKSFGESGDCLYERSVNLEKPQNNTVWKLLDKQLISQISTEFPLINLKKREEAYGFTVEFQGRKQDVDDAVDWAEEKQKGILCGSCCCDTEPKVEILKRSLDDGMLDLQVLASKAKVEYKLLELTQAKAVIEVASFSEEDAFAFSRALDNYLSGQAVQVTEVIPTSGSEMEFLQRGRCDLVESDTLSLDVFDSSVMLRGSKYAVRSSMQKLKDLLRGFIAEDFDVSYPRLAFNAAKAEFQAIQQRRSSPECVIHIVPPDSLPSVGFGASRISIFGVNKDAILSAKQEMVGVPCLLKQFSRAVSVSFLSRSDLPEKLIELEKQLSVGLIIRKKDVFVYATSLSHFKRAEVLIKKKINELDKDRHYKIANKSLMQTLFSAAWTDVVHLAKSSKVFAERNEVDNSILIRGPSQGVGKFRNALDSYVEKLTKSRTPAQKQAPSCVYRHPSDFVMQALCTTYWRKVVVQASRFLVFAQKSRLNNSIRIFSGSKLKTSSFPKASAKFCEALDSLACAIDDEASESERCEADVSSPVCERCICICGGNVMLPLLKKCVIDHVRSRYPHVTALIECDASVPKIDLTFRGNQSDVDAAVIFAEDKRRGFSWSEHTFNSKEIKCLKSGIERDTLKLRQLGEKIGAACDVSRISDGILSVAAMSPCGPQAFRNAVDDYLQENLIVTAERFLTEMQQNLLTHLYVQKACLGLQEVVEENGFRVHGLSENRLLLNGSQRKVDFALAELEKTLSRFQEVSIDFSYPDGAREIVEKKLFAVQKQMIKVLINVSFVIAENTRNAFRVTLSGFDDLSSAKDTILALSRSYHRFHQPIQIPVYLCSVIYEQALNKSLPVELFEDNVLIVFETSIEAMKKAERAVNELLEKERNENSGSGSCLRLSDEPSTTEPCFRLETRSSKVFSSKVCASAHGGDLRLGIKLSKSSATSSLSRSKKVTLLSSKKIATSGSPKRLRISFNSVLSSSKIDDTKEKEAPSLHKRTTDIPCTADDSAASSECERRLFISGRKVILPLIKKHIVAHIRFLFPQVTVLLHYDDSVPNVVVQFRGSEEDVASAVHWTEEKRNSFSWTCYTFDGEETDCLLGGINSKVLKPRNDHAAACDVSRLFRGIVGVATIYPEDPKAIKRALDIYLEEHLYVTAEYRLTDRQLEFLKCFRFQEPWLGFGEVVKSGVKTLMPSASKKCLILKGTKQNVQFGMEQLENIFCQFREDSYKIDFPKGSRRFVEDELVRLQQQMFKGDVLFHASPTVAVIQEEFRVVLAGFGDLSKEKNTVFALSQSFHLFSKTINVPDHLRSIVCHQALKTNLPVGIVDDSLVLFETSSESSLTTERSLNDLVARASEDDRNFVQRITIQNEASSAKILGFVSQDNMVSAKAVAAPWNTSTKLGFHSESTHASSFSSSSWTESRLPCEVKRSFTNSTQKEAAAPSAGGFKESKVLNNLSASNRTSLWPNVPNSSTRSRLLKKIFFSTSGKYLEVCTGSVAGECVDVIISATGRDLVPHADLAAIGGTSISEECVRYTKDNGFVEKGHIVVTNSGCLQCDCVLHVVTSSLGSASELRASLKECFDIVEALSASSVSLPLLFDDSNMSVLSCFVCMVEQIRRRLEEGSCVKFVRIVDSNPELLNFEENEFFLCRSTLTGSNDQEFSEISQSGDTVAAANLERHEKKTSENIMRSEDETMKKSFPKMPVTKDSRVEEEESSSSPPISPLPKEVKKTKRSLFVKKFFSRFKKVIPISGAHDYIAGDCLGKIREIGDSFGVRVKIIYFGFGVIHSAELKGVKSDVLNAYRMIQETVFTPLITDLENYPFEWEPQTEEVELKRLRSMSSEYAKVLERIRSLIPEISLRKIERIQNRRLWDMHREEEKKMRCNNDCDVNAMELFYGDRDAEDSQIYSSGFDYRFMRSGTCGKGHYFSVEASYSHDCAYQDSVGNRHIFLARVLTGNSFEIPRWLNLRKAPLRLKRTETCGGDIDYDSVNRSANGSTVFTTYISEKAYPLYLITYGSRSSLM